MAHVRVDGPHRDGPGGKQFDVECDGIAFSVSTRPSGTDPMAPWEADVCLSDGRTFGGAGTSRRDAYRAACTLATSKGALARVEWPSVTKGLEERGAFA